MGGKKKKIACRDHCEICERVQGDFLRWMKNWVWILHASSGERKEKNNGGGYVSYPPSSKKYLGLLEQALTLVAYLCSMNDIVND